MTDWNLALKGGSYVIEGLKPEFSAEWTTDTLLLKRYPEGDCDTVSEFGEPMHAALYDAYQCESGLSNGDTFSIDGVVKFKCEGVHVVEV